MIAPIEMTKRIITLKFPWNIWVMFMALVNIGGGLYFYSTIEAQFALISMAMAFITMSLLYAKYGFVRLLGAAHIYWIPLVIWFVQRLLLMPEMGIFKMWMLTLVIVNTLSLIVDTIDVVRYVRGDQAEI